MTGIRREVTYVVQAQSELSLLRAAAMLLWRRWLWPWAEAAAPEAREAARATMAYFIAKGWLKISKRTSKRVQIRTTHPRKKKFVTKVLLVDSVWLKECPLKE